MADQSSESTVFLNGKPVENPHEDHHHVTPLWVFTAVFIALLILTILTYVVSFLGLGAASLPVAMIVAFFKGALVVGYFMHLKYEDRFYSFLFLVTLLFVGIFFTFTMFDMNTTGKINEEAAVHWKRGVQDSAEASDSAAAAKAAAANASAASAPAAGGH